MSESTTKWGGGGVGGIGGSGSNKKPSKPFCSIAYLAKSTICNNGNSNDFRNKNGQNNNLQIATIVKSTSATPTPSTTPTPCPNLAATAKVNNHSNSNHNNNNNTSSTKRRSPALPVECAATGDHLIAPIAVKVNGKLNGHSDVAAVISNEFIIGDGMKTDIFGEINEEQPLSCDQVDHQHPNHHHHPNNTNADIRRPWELTSNSFVRRVPTALMTNGAVNQNGFNGHGQSLSSLSSKLNSIDCWDYTIELECLKGPQDLQLAAELGKTLLERNKELETLLKEHKNTIDEQDQEIVYLKKHTAALREVNDSRLKVYEQLEVGIQDLERANHRLLVENTSDKKHIKTLTNNIENLESRCDELNKQLDETRQALSMERRKNERLLQDRNNSSNNEFAVRLKPIGDTKSNSDRSSSEAGFEPNTTAPENCSFAFLSPGQTRHSNSTDVSGTGQSEKSLDLSQVVGGDENEEIIKLVNDLETTKRAFMAEQQRCTELEEQLVAIIQENQTLQSRIAQTSANEEMKSMHDELSILDEVRQGQMCSRCLRSVEDRATVNDEQSSIAPTEEDDERSMLDDNASECNSQALGEAGAETTYRAGATIKMSQRVADSLELNCPASPNPYRDLVEKYEALLEVQRSSIARKANNFNGNGSNKGSGIGAGELPLVEEFQTTGEFNQTQKLMIQAAAAAVAAAANGDAASSCNGSTTHEGNITAQNQQLSNKNTRGRTPTEFSEAETSSSGYSGDDTSNKCTQTDDRPGYFLCSIGDGEDCKFSIYDDISPIDSRFRNRPEYRELFKEIFAVLKKAAENKEEGDKLPLLDDTHPTTASGGGATNAATAIGGAIAKVPPVTPANEEPPTDFGDDTQSIISSAVSEQSFAMSECITKIERRVAKKHIIEKNQENKPPSCAQLVGTSTPPIVENGRMLTPLKREPLEYLTVGVGIKKKNRRKGRNFSNDRSESPVALPSPPRFFVNSGKKRKDARPLPITPEQQTNTRAQRERSGPRYEWNGSSMVIYNRSVQSPRGRELDYSGMEYRPSTVSQDLHKLKKLDLSYAEVLRRADACKHGHSHQYPQQNQQQLRRRHQHNHN